MGSSFSIGDPVRCQHYAQFAAHLDRLHFDVIYWILFSLVIILLFTSSWCYGSTLDSVSNYAPGSPEHRRKMRKCMYICIVYAAIALVAIVFEVFALMALQFCEGEDLMPLYWSTWTVTQVGSEIAILGILLAVYHTMRGRKQPPWALALGTPVLVIAGLGHVLQHTVRRRVARSRPGSSDGRPVVATRGLPISRQETLREEAGVRASIEYNARLVGYTIDGAPIIQFNTDPGPLNPRRGSVIGVNSTGHVTVVFHKAMTTSVAGSVLALHEEEVTSEAPTLAPSEGIITPNQSGSASEPVTGVEGWTPNSPAEPTSRPNASPC